MKPNLSHSCFCPRCGIKLLNTKTAFYCAICHPIVVAEMHARENLPVGRLSSSEAFELRTDMGGGNKALLREERSPSGKRIIRKGQEMS